MIAHVMLILSTILAPLWKDLIEIVLLNHQQTSILPGIMSLCLPDQFMTSMDEALVILSDPHMTEPGIMIIKIALQCVLLPTVVTDLHIAVRNPHMVGRDPHIIGIGIEVVTMIIK